MAAGDPSWFRGRSLERSLHRPGRMYATIQRAAGGRMRQILSGITNNPVSNPQTFRNDPARPVNSLPALALVTKHRKALSSSQRQRPPADLSVVSSMAP